MRLSLIGAVFCAAVLAQEAAVPVTPPVITVPAGAAAIEQTAQGAGAAAAIVESFDGLGVGFVGPHGTLPPATRPTTASPWAPTTSCRS